MALPRAVQDGPLTPAIDGDDFIKLRDDSVATLLVENALCYVRTIADNISQKIAVKTASDFMPSKSVWADI